MNKYITELLGAFFLTLIAALTGNPFAIGAGLMVLIYMGGHVSGAHYNPAVSLGVFLRGKMEAKNLLPYVIFQILGGFLAAVIYYLFMEKTTGPAPGPGVAVWKAVVAEILFTTLLVLVVLNVATSPATAGNQYFGLAIGFTVMAGAFAVSPISGAAFNPAVAIGLICMDLIRGGSSAQYIWIYIVGPLAGGAIAAYLYKMMNPAEKAASA
jgi:aquaporin Z